MGKYTVNKDGIMEFEPSYAPASTQQRSMPIVSNFEDIIAARHAREAAGENFTITESTQKAITCFQDPDFTNGFELSAGKNVDSKEILASLTQIFSQYEIPIGLLHKLLDLMAYDLRMIIDDSGSMQLPSDLLRKEATSYMRNRKAPEFVMQENIAYLSRWEEAEDRLHILMDVLSHIPTAPITIRSMNHNHRDPNNPNFELVLDHKNKTPAEFAADAHAKIMQVFNYTPSQRTPTRQSLDNSLQASYRTGRKTMHFLFTDGEPNGPGESIHTVSALILGRQLPESNPITLISCTNEDGATEWMKRIEETARYVAEVDDYNDESREVLKDQGPGLPYSRGFWLLAMLVGAINPMDIDALDDEEPFSCKTLSDLLGYQVNPQEYFHRYFDHHPNKSKYVQYYDALLTIPDHAKIIIHRTPLAQVAAAHRPLQQSGNGGNHGFYQPHTNSHDQKPTTASTYYSPL